MIMVDDSADPLGRAAMRTAAVLVVAVLLTLIPGSAWPNSVRSERPSLDTGRACSLSVVWQYRA